MRPTVAQGHAVLGDGGAQHGDGVGGGGGGLEGRGGVGHNQVHAVGHKAVDDGGAGGGIAGGVLILNVHLTGKLLVEGVDEALGGVVQGGVGGQLANAHHVFLTASGLGAVFGGGAGRGALHGLGAGGGAAVRAGAAGAGGKGQGHDQRQQQRGQLRGLFHSVFLQTMVALPLCAAKAPVAQGMSLSAHGR